MAQVSPSMHVGTFGQASSSSPSLIPYHHCRRWSHRRRRGRIGSRKEKEKETERGKRTKRKENGQCSSRERRRKGKEKIEQKKKTGPCVRFHDMNEGPTKQFNSG